MAGQLGERHALASGFGSIRRFNETFRALYGRGPSELRRRRAPLTAPDEGISLLLRYRPPYDWDALLSFLATRAVPGVETVVDGHYRRVVEVAGALGTIEVAHEPAAAALRVTVRFPRLDALPEIIARVRRLFDLGANPTAISAALARDPILAPLVEARPDLRVPGGWDGFEIAVRAVLGQQITVKGAVHAAARLVRDLGRPLDAAAAASGLTHAFPGPERFANGYVASGMPRARATALTGLAAAMRALRESDAFLAGDVAVHRILAVRGVRPTAREVLARSHAWRPWRAYAVLHLWTGEALADAALTA
ncbi:MAG: AlkA N-terminal domain-containing protein [Vulcanimicrobiaceae bacterium]